MKNLLTIVTFVLVLILSSATEILAGYGTAPNINQAPVCTRQKPGQAQFSFIRKSGRNQIEVGWNQVDRATSWTIAYGTESGRYIYGMADFGNNESRSVRINMLPPGTYYLVIKANNGCMPGNFSAERRITVYRNGRFAGYQRRSFSSYFQPLARPTPIVIITNVNTQSTVTPTITPVATSTPILTTVKIATPTPTPTPAKKRLGLFRSIWVFFFGE